MSDFILSEAKKARVTSKSITHDNRETTMYMPRVIEQKLLDRVKQGKSTVLLRGKQYAKF